MGAHCSHSVPHSPEAVQSSTPPSPAVEVVRSDIGPSGQLAFGAARPDLHSKSEPPAGRKVASDSAATAAAAPTARSRNVKARPGDGGRIILKHYGNILDFYDMEDKLGEGAFGCVCLATHRATGVPRAVKTVPRGNAHNVQVLNKEISTMKAMDHPNIIKLFETFEDRKCIYLAMELCSGGELFDRIIEARRFSEADAAIVMRQMLSAVYYMHDVNIAHRDLKPENFLFSTRDPIKGNVLKLIDFGLACPCPPGTVLKSKLGTPTYMAPQVLMCRYDKQCDMWSAGVIMYILLSGTPPIQGSNDKEIMRRVREGKWQFQGKSWTHVSSDAKELIRALLRMNPRVRLTAQEALNHDWVKHCAPRAEAHSELEASLIDRLCGFKAQNKLKRAALQIVASQLCETRLKDLREAFQSLDVNGDGRLSAEELAQGIERSGIDLSPSKVDAILNNVDQDKSGSIDYTEFVAATLDRSADLTDEALWTAFHVFDRDGDGKITVAELRSVLQTRRLSPDSIYEVMKKADMNGDGMIEFDEFKNMMRRTDAVSSDKFMARARGGGA